MRPTWEVCMTTILICIHFVWVRNSWGHDKWQQKGGQRGENRVCDMNISTQAFILSNDKKTKQKLSRHNVAVLAELKFELHEVWNPETWSIEKEQKIPELVLGSAAARRGLATICKMSKSPLVGPLNPTGIVWTLISLYTSLFWNCLIFSFTNTVSPVWRRYARLKNYNWLNQTSLVLLLLLLVILWCDK